MTQLREQHVTLRICPEVIKSRRMKKPITALSLFSGGGGMDLGFAAAGYEICCSTDKDPFSCRTLELNAGKKEFFRPHKVVEADIRTLNVLRLLEELGINKSAVDIVIGGPPCQAFSVFGQRKGLGDPRGNLVWDFLKVVNELRPTAFVFENVSGLRTIHNGHLYQRMLESLSMNGKYAVSDHNYELADFGIPQFRNRIFFIGWKNGKRIPPMVSSHGEQDLFGLRPFNTVSKALAGLPNPGSRGSPPNHLGRNHSRRIIERYRSLSFGERDSKTRINKLNPDRPSFTIIVGSDAGGGKGHVHPYVPREVTPRESARLQTFPDWWAFAGTGRHVIRQVGNAVPPLFAALLAEHVRKYVFQGRLDRSLHDFASILDIDFVDNIAT